MGAVVRNDYRETRLKISGVKTKPCSSIWDSWWNSIKSTGLWLSHLSNLASYSTHCLCLRQVLLHVLSFPWQISQGSLSSS